MPYIADTYATNRQMDSSQAKKNGEFASMTARQLLSILRLAQAHAKLYFRDVVRMEDVDEALRLVYMSKASVLETESVWALVPASQPPTRKPTSLQLRQAQTWCRSSNSSRSGRACRYRVFQEWRTNQNHCTFPHPCDSSRL